MGKATAAMALVFVAGGGVMSALSGLGGGWAEAAALAMVGLGMLGTSRLLAGAASKAKQQAEPAAQPPVGRNA
jgi:hypothetical protein